MNFEEYLSSKKIDSDAFRSAEPSTWETWKAELEQMHPNSFTIQKLNLINPVRRKYPLKQSALETQKSGANPKESLRRSEEQEVRSDSEVKNVEGQGTSTPQHPDASTQSPAPKPGVARPVFKPKPKIN